MEFVLRQEHTKINQSNFVWITMNIGLWMCACVCCSNQSCILSDSWSLDRLVRTSHSDDHLVRLWRKWATLTCHQNVSFHYLCKWFLIRFNVRSSMPRLIHTAFFGVKWISKISQFEHMNKDISYVDFYYSLDCFLYRKTLILFGTVRHCRVIFFFFAQSHWLWTNESWETAESSFVNQHCCCFAGVKLIRKIC